MIYEVGVILLLALIIFLLFWRLREAQSHTEKDSMTFQAILSTSTDAIMVLDDADTLLFINDAMNHLLHLHGNEKKLSELSMPEFYIEKEKKYLKDLIKEANIARGKDPLFFAPQIEVKTPRHQRMTVDLYLGDIQVSGSRHRQHIVIIRDLREVIKEIALGERDPLSHLPNRARAYKDFQVLCSQHHIHEEKITLMAISLDNFLITRSLLGHEKTDSTILAVTHTLMQLSLLHHYKTYHLTYATFLLVLPGSFSVDDAFQLAETLQESLAKLYKEHRSAAYLTASVGIASSPESGQPIALFDNVHKALIEAKKHGTGGIHLFQQIQEKHTYDESALQHDLQYAIEREELQIYYQPIVDAATREVVAAEALMRWQHPRHGMIPPNVFIPLMEKTGFIIEAGRYLIREVIQQQKKWKQFGFKEINVSLNVSMREIEIPDYVEYLEVQLEESHIDPHTIKIEITESLAMGSSQKILDALSRIDALGIPLALDDFGTGYTSFSYLIRLPANTLKIDKSFIDNILTNVKHQQVVQAIIEVGHALQMQIVAEGIEDESTAELLQKYGAECLQGYFFSKPVPVFEVQAMLRKKEVLPDEQVDSDDNNKTADTLPLRSL